MVYKNPVKFIHLGRVQTTFNDSIEFFCYSIILEKLISTLDFTYM